MSRAGSANTASRFSHSFGRVGVLPPAFRHRPVGNEPDGTPAPPAGIDGPLPAQTAPTKPPPPPCLPTLTSFEARTTGTIQMTTAWPPVGDCKLAFGVPGAPGMTFDAVVDVPKKCEGALVFQQHIDFCRQYREVGGKDMHRKSSGWALDTRDIYELMMVRSSGSIPFSTNDSPDNPVDGDEFSSASDRFRMYLLWFPKKISEPPMVPLGVAEWYWNAAATKGAATPSSGPTSAPASGTSGCTTGWTISTADANGYKGTATSTMPTMTKTAPDDFKDVPGAC